MADTRPDHDRDEPLRVVTDGGQDDSKVIGHNTDGTGETIGVWGEVDSPDGVGLATPNDARIDGSVDAGTGWRVKTVDGDDAGPVLQGHASNAATKGAVGATVAGGGFDDASTIEPNLVTDDYGTVGGGRANRAGDAAARERLRSAVTERDERIGDLEARLDALEADASRADVPADD